MSASVVCVDLSSESDEEVISRFPSGHPPRVFVCGRVTNPGVASHFDDSAIASLTALELSNLTATIQTNTHHSAIQAGKRNKNKMWENIPTYSRTRSKHRRATSVKN